MEDSEIIGLYHSRSEDALSQTAQKYGGYCRSIAWNILGNVLDTEETLNDTWLAAWNSIPPQKPRRLSVYLGRITRNLALNRLKAQNTKKRGGGQTEAVLEEQFSGRLDSSERSAPSGCDSVSARRRLYLRRP